MFIFPHPPEFSPKLPADGESEIRGIQIQRDPWGWSGVEHRIWIFLEQARFNYGIWTGVLIGIKILSLHLQLILDIHGYTKISIFLHWHFQEFQNTTLGTSSLHYPINPSVLIICKISGNINIDLRFMQITQLRTEWVKWIHELQFGFGIDFILSFLFPGRFFPALLKQNSLRYLCGLQTVAHKT